ncbi:protein of unknown function [Daejeonella rubra]|uniref:DUF4286 domain-containing protein n=1 Tax=Daejeonella rubra TaxID=990371 RepID=A0A1G9U433_9SPHI|nr:DUF4286 family protein [Daejeonella rubra]SDM54593.1 protein of unknown function [Daejeonella rubra]
MILYNVTIILDDEIHNEWLNWIKTKQIPDVMNTGCFVSNRMLKVVDSPNEGVTYCIQYISDSLEKLNEFRQIHERLIQASTPEQFNNKLVAFQTVMDFIDNQ